MEDEWRMNGKKMAGKWFYRHIIYKDKAREEPIVVSKYT
jgi:hypothetical protein